MTDERRLEKDRDKAENPNDDPTEAPTDPDFGVEPGWTTVARQIGRHEGVDAEQPVISAEDQQLVRFFGNYELLEEIARGGMGVVYKARQVSLNRIVALKMILAGQLASEHDVQRFQIEAEAAANLDHPGIVPIFEVGQHEGQHFFSMGFVEGESLAKKVADGPLPPKEAAELTKSVAEAIVYAHERGVVHRDLKPANILLDDNGRPRVTDFGLAKKMETDSGLTGIGQVLGTPSFMPPEQAAGKTDEIGPLSDVYSLGAILYCLLTGRPPFQAANVMDTLKQVLEQEPVSPRQLNTGIDRDLETICLKCLEKEASRRYQTAKDLSDDLRRFLEGESILARSIGSIERAVRWMKRRPTVTVLTGVLFLVGSLGVAGVAWFHQGEQEARREIEDLIYELDIPAGLRAVSFPSDNRMTNAKVSLGKQLFFDRRLSHDDTVSCADCHDPAKGWSNGKPYAAGVGSKVTPHRRNVPTLINVAYKDFYNLDGRASSLEEQALGPILDPDEMDMKSLEKLEQKLRGIEGYRDQFRQVFDEDVTAGNVAKALAAFQRTILSGDAPYDRYQAGDETALSPAAVKGRHLFFNKARCIACHVGPNLNDDNFHNIGIAVNSSDLGRLAIRDFPWLRRAFGTPTLREIVLTAPYMHDGSLPTLEDVIEHYNRGGVGGVRNPELDESIYSLGLTDQEKRDLLTFLREGFSGRVYPIIEPPELPD